MKIYKIDNGYLLPIELDEKQLKERKKKYFFYEKDNFLIFNFDYNKIKPFVMSILSKKKYLEDLNKKLLLLVGLFFISIIGINYFQNYQTKKELEKTKDFIQTFLSGKVIKVEKPKKIKEVKLKSQPFNLIKNK